MGKKKGYTMKEKLSHYTAVSKGDKPVKDGSKFSTAEQRAYARGQRDARNESNAVYASKQATPEQKAAHKAKQAERAAAYKAGKAESKAGRKAKNKAKE